MSKRNPLARAADPVKACADLIRHVSHRHRLHQVFSDFVEMSAIAISNSVDAVHREAREARYMQIIGGYEREDVELFPQMLARLVDGLESGPMDFLGQLFMGLALGSHWAGQFFTPYEICALMARMTSTGVTMESIEQLGGFICINEPACGAGAMVIAYADALRAQDINYQRHLHATLQDIDKTAVHMSYIQMALMGVPAVVIQGNSLALEVREYWLTPAHILGGWDRKLALRAAAMPAPAAEPAVATAAAPVDEMMPGPVDLAAVRDRIVTMRIDADQLALF